PEQSVADAAAADMFSWFAPVSEHDTEGTPGFHQGAAQRGHVLEGALLIDGPGRALDAAVLPVEPGRVQLDGPERVADHVAEQPTVQGGEVFAVRPGAGVGGATGAFFGGYHAVAVIRTG